MQRDDLVHSHANVGQRGPYWLAVALLRLSDRHHIGQPGLLAVVDTPTCRLVLPRPLSPEAGKVHTCQNQTNHCLKLFTVCQSPEPDAGLPRSGGGDRLPSECAEACSEATWAAQSSDT